LLSHFTQPGKAFYDEFTNRLKVIACIEKPNMATSEDLDDVVSSHVFEQIQDVLEAGESDAQILFWAPEADVKTALDTIEERAKMAFEGVPKETRKSFVDGTTIFERVLPGADRMYPDTDSAPIPLDNAYIESLSKNIPEEIANRYDQLQKWEIPEDTYTYIFSNNLYPYIKNCVENLQITPKKVGVLFGQKLKHLHGQHKFITFNLNKIYEILSYLDENKKDIAIMPKLLDLLFVKPDISLEEIKDLIGYNHPDQDMIKDMLKKRSAQFKNKRKDTTKQDKINYLMGIVRPLCEGFYDLKEVSSWI
jgi:glutamyl-tRNA(Gln) amidotransferase subunit E